MSVGDMRIFISHSHEDNAFCKQLVDTLADFPVDFWYDQTNLTRGAVITDEIAREIKQRPISLFILSPSAMRSGWVKLEARGIVEQSVHDPTRMIIPITVQPLSHDDFVDSWIFLQGIKRIESDQTYQPLPVEEAIRHLLWALTLEDRPIDEKSAFETKAEDLVKRSRPYLARRDFIKTLNLVDDAIKGDSSLFDAWFIKGEAHLGLGAAYDLGNNSMAHQSFMRSVFLAATNDKKATLLPTALCGEGRALMALLRQPEARTRFKRAIFLDPHYAEAWTWLGKARLGLGDRRRALHAFDEATRQDSLLSSAYYGKAETLQRLRRMKQALDALEQTIALDINNSDAWRQKAQLLAQIPRRFQEAEDAFYALVKIDPHTAENWKLLGELYIDYHLGKEPYETKALDALEEAAKLAPDDKSIWMHIARLTSESHLKMKAKHVQAEAQLQRLNRY